MASLTSFQLMGRSVRSVATRRAVFLMTKVRSSSNRFYCVTRNFPSKEVRPWVKHAFLFGIVVAGTKTASADILVQKRIENAPTIDWRRVKIFCLFGVVFCGMWQYFLYNKMFPLIIPGIDRFLALPIRARFRDVEGLKGVAIQCSIENFFNNAFCYFPVFYTVKLFLEGSGSLNPMLGIRRYIETWREDMWNAFKVWIPAQTFNFLFCPMWARVSFTALVSFGFTAYVSYLRGAPEELAEAVNSVVEEVPEMLAQTAAIVAPIGEECGLGEEVSQNLMMQMDAVINDPPKQSA